MAKWGMVIDVSKCTACYSCFVACKDEYWDNDYPPFTAAQPRLGQFWMNILYKERGKYPYIKAAYQPLPCMHCSDAPCMKAAKGGAIYERPDGIVVIDPKKAVGQKQIVKACPYDVIFWNEERKLPQKCTFCAHRLPEGKLPRCVEACPSGCLNFGDLNNPKSEVSKMLKAAKAEVFHPEWKTKPKVFYIDLHKMTKSFIAGEVVFGDSDECAKGATVTLTGAAGKAVKTTANAYGNFEFDGLEPGKYSLTIGNPGYKAKTLEVILKTDSYLGDIFLAKA